MDEDSLERLLDLCRRRSQELPFRDAQSGELKLTKTGVYLIRRDGQLSTFERIPWTKFIGETRISPL